MAAKRQTHTPPPPPTHRSDSETEDHEHSGSGSSSSDDSDSEPKQLTQTKPQQTRQDSSDSDSGSASDSDSVEPQKPLSPVPKKPVSKPTQLKANGKRSAEIDQIEKEVKSKKIKAVEKGSKSDTRKSVGKVEKGSKKGKVDEEGGEIEDKKGTLFARLFTEKDEIVLLEGMIDYMEKKGGDPSSNIVAFHESVEDFLSCSVTKSQVADKIRRLKKKYVNNLKRGRDGEDPVFSRPHEYKSFELSKKIWGSEGLGSEVNGDSKVKRSIKEKDKKDDNAVSKTPLVGKQSDFKDEVMDKSEIGTADCWSLYPLLCASLESEAIKNFSGPMSPKEYVNEVVSGLKKEKAAELEQEWKGFNVMERQVYVKRLKVLSKQAEAALNVVQH